MEKKKIIERGVIVVIALIVVSTVIKTVKENSKAIEVKTVRVEKGQITKDVIYSGIVAPEDIAPVYIDSAGTIEDVYVRVGDEVKKGDKLLSFSHKSVAENEKALKLNELDMKNVELQIQNQESGSMKLELDSKQLEIKNLDEQIKANQRKLPLLEEDAKVAKKKVEVYKTLLESDSVSSIEYNQVTAASSKADAALDEMRTSLLLDKERYQLMFVSYEKLKRDLEISRNQLDTQLERLKLENENLKAMDKQLREPFKSPVNGVITEIEASPGGSVSPGQRVFSVAVPESNKVKLELPIYQIDSIKKGQTAIVISRDGDVEKRYKGVVQKVSAAAVTSNYGKNRVIAVEVVVTEPNDLRPGFLADVELTGKGKSGVPLLSSFSVIQEGQDYYVYINDYGVARKRKVEVGLKSSNYYEVLDLPTDAEVIVNPHKVTDGKKIKVKN